MSQPIGDLNVLFDRNESGTYFGIARGRGLLLSGYFTRPGTGHFCGGTVDVMSWKLRGVWEHELFNSPVHTPRKQKPAS